MDISVNDSRVYKLAFELQQEVFATSKHFPKEERYALTDQVRRAFRSIRAIFPKPGTRGGYPAHFVRKLTDADGECVSAGSLWTMVRRIAPWEIVQGYVKHYPWIASGSHLRGRLCCL